MSLNTDSSATASPKDSKKKLFRRKHQNSKNGCVTCKKRRVKCSEDFPACLNCVKHKVRCDYLDLSSEEREMLILAKKAREKEMRRERSNSKDEQRDDMSSKSRQDSPLGSSSAGTTPRNDSDSHDGKQRLSPFMLSSGKYNPQTFTISYTKESIKHSLKKNMEFDPDVVDTATLLKYSLDSPSLLKMFDYCWFTYVTNATKNILPFDSLLCFSTTFIRANAVKNFGFDQKYDHLTEIRKIQKVMYQKSMKYYGRSISELRGLIAGSRGSRGHSDTAFYATYATWVLTFVSFYREPKLSSFWTFLVGLTAVLKDIAYASEIQNDNIHVEMFAECMLDCSKTIYFPSYNPSFLHEFSNHLMSFKDILFDSSLINYRTDNGNCRFAMGFNHDNLLYYYNQLVKFVHELIRVTNDFSKNTDPENTNPTTYSPELMYAMFRRWYCIVPPNISSLCEETHPIAKTLFMFYESLSRGLFALFPEVRYLFLVEFSGPLQIFALPNKAIFKNLNYNNTLNKSITSQLKKLLTYNLRLLNFFQKRSNILYKGIKLSDFHTDINEEYIGFRKLNDANETMITNFNSVFIKSENYPHLTHTYKNGHFNGGQESLRNPHEFEELSTDLLDFNFGQITESINDSEINLNTGLLKKDYDALDLQESFGGSDESPVSNLANSKNLEKYYTARMAIMSKSRSRASSVQGGPDSEWFEDTDYTSEGF